VGRDYFSTAVISLVNTQVMGDRSSALVSSFCGVLSFGARYKGASLLWVCLSCTNEWSLARAPVHVPTFLDYGCITQE